MGIEKYNLESEVNQSLTENLEAKNAMNNKKWTAYLILCILIVCLSSFQFGYNVGAINSVTPVMVDYFEKSYYKTIFFDKLGLLENGTNFYLSGLNKYKEGKAYLEKATAEIKAAEERRNNYLDIMFSFDEEKIAAAKEHKRIKEIEIREKYNMSIEEFMPIAKKKIEEGKIKLAEGRKKLLEGKKKIEDGRAKVNAGRAKLDVLTDMMWAIFNVFFIVGGMIGAFTSKYVTDRFGYKGGILFHHLFTFAGTVFIILPFYTSVPVYLIKFGRFLYGIQGGMACGLVPSYLYEISPFGLRNKTGLMHSVSVAFGILVSQILGFTQILGSPNLFQFLLTFSVVPAILGSLLLFIVLPDSPRTLLENDEDEKARDIVKKLRNSKSINGEIQLLYKEIEDMSNTDKIRFYDLVSNKNLRWPVFCCVMLQIAQQFCGINVIFFYSRILFETAGVPDKYLQCAVLLTGLVNFVALAVLLPLLDKLSRKKTLTYTMTLMVIDLACLVVFMAFKETSCYFAYVSVACVLILVVLFAAGLSHIPFMFVEECFEKDARSSPLHLCIVTNWVAALLVVLNFPLLINPMQGYIFVISILVLVITLVSVIRTIPETKGKNAAQIQADFK